MKMPKRFVPLTLILVLLIVAALIVIALTRKPVTAILTMSPAAAQATLDGKIRVKPGSLRLSPGHHSITASFNGFSSQTVQFTIPTRKTSSPESIDIILNTNSQAGINYLLQHPADQKIREAVGGASFGKTTQTMQDKYPIIKQLPYVGPGNSYRIDYGPAPGEAGGNQIEIQITYYTNDGQQAALNWIQSQGYDPSQLPLAYTNDTGDTSQTQINNPYTD